MTTANIRRANTLWDIRASYTTGIAARLRSLNEANEFAVVGQTRAAGRFA